MRVAYVITKMYSLATDITLSHLEHLPSKTDLTVANFHNIVIITETLKKSK